MKGRVFKSDRQEFIVKLDETGDFINATPKGNILKDGEVVVGDYVTCSLEKDEYVINDITDRENEVFRMLVRERKKKVTAANIDYLVIVVSVGKPSYKRGLVDRYLVRAYQWGIKPLVVFNKIDEIKKKLDLSFEIQRLAALEVPCYEVSAKEPEMQPLFLGKSLMDLKQCLNHQTSLFLGQSGVGKSHLITTLSDGEITLKSSKLAKVGKGAHTTTWSEIVESQNLTLVDSPGIRSFSLQDIDPADLIHYFPDLFEVAKYCEFADCQHQEDSKGCAFFKEAQRSKPTFPYLISRLESYLKIFEEASQIPEWQKK